MEMMTETTTTTMKEEDEHNVRNNGIRSPYRYLSDNGEARDGVSANRRDDVDAAVAGENGNNQPDGTEQNGGTKKQKGQNDETNDQGKDSDSGDSNSKKKKQEQDEKSDENQGQPNGLQDTNDRSHPKGFNQADAAMEPSDNSAPKPKPSDGKRTTCPDGTECQNGSVCVLQGDKHICDCSAIEEDYYAGAHCEYVATSYCDDKSSSRKQQTQSSPSFCTNQGTCVTSAEDEFPPACLCPAPFRGPHCEVKGNETSFADALRHDAKVAVMETKVFLDDLDGVSVMAIIAGALIMGLLLGYCCTNRKGCCYRWGCFFCCCRCCCCTIRSARKKKIKRSMILAQYRRLSEKDPLMKEASASNPGRRPNFWDDEQNVSLDDSHDDFLDDEESAE